MSSRDLRTSAIQAHVLAGEGRALLDQLGNTGRRAQLQRTADADWFKTALSQTASTSLRRRRYPPARIAPQRPRTPDAIDSLLPPRITKAWLEDLGRSAWLVRAKREWGPSQYLDPAKRNGRRWLATAAREPDVFASRSGSTRYVSRCASRIWERGWGGGAASKADASPRA